VRDYAPVMASHQKTWTVLNMKDRVPSRRRRAVAIIYFFALGLPFLLFGFAISVDVPSLISTRRALQLVAESASVAGSFQYDASGGGGLDVSAATSAARDLCRKSLEVNAIPRQSVSLAGGPENWCKVSFGTARGRPVSVRVSIEYSPKGLFIIPLLDYLYDWKILQSLGAAPVAEAAAVCNPEFDFLDCRRPGTGSEWFDRAPTGPVSPYAPEPSNAGSPWTPNDALRPQGYSKHYPSHYPPHYPPHYSGHYAPDDSGTTQSTTPTRPGGSPPTTQTPGCSDLPLVPC